MNRTFISAVFVAGLAATSAFAQSGASNGVENLPEASDYFMSPDMKDFYTNDTMSSMRSDDDMKAAFGKMSSEQQAKLQAACAADKEGKHSAMCKAAM